MLISWQHPYFLRASRSGVCGAFLEDRDRRLTQQRRTLFMVETPSGDEVV